jgi:hypothetical protein
MRFKEKKKYVEACERRGEKVPATPKGDRQQGDREISQRNKTKQN